MKAFLFLIRANFIHFLSYRAEAVASFAFNLIPIAVMFFLWSSLYGDGETKIAGIGRDQMIIFSTLAVALKELYFSRVDNQIVSKVHNGEISLIFIRPFSPLLQFLSHDISLAISNLLKRFLPLLILVFCLYPDYLPSFQASVFSICSIILSYATLWIISACFGSLAFLYTHTGATNQIKDQIIRILSGAVIPIWFFPLWAQNISAWLPFHYIYQLPLGILIGRYNQAKIFGQLSIQLLWLVVLILVLQLIWSQCRTHLQIQGG